VPALLALVVYANTVPNGFTVDDEWIVQKNPLIRGFARLPELISSGYWAARHTSGGLWRPFTMATYTLNYVMGGLEPSAFHTVNLFLHAGVTLLATLLLLRLTASRGVAILGGALFAVHPIHVEAVAGVVGRAELLSCGGVLVALLAHARAGVTGGSARRGWSALALAAFALAVFSKENAVVFVALAPLLDLAAVRQRSQGGETRALRKALPRYLGYLAIAVVYLALRAVTLHTLTTEVPTYDDNPLISLNPLERFLAALALVPRYGVLFLWPARLAYDYGPGAFPLLSPMLSILGGVILAALIALAVIARRRAPAVAFLAAFTFLTYVIVSNLFITIGASMGERLMYLPSVGVLGLVAVGIAALVARAAPGRGWITLAVGALLVLPLGARSVARNRDWVDNRTLFLADGRGANLSTKALFNAGLMHFQDGDAKTAVEYFTRAAALFPSAKTSFFLGRALGQTGDEAGRERLYRETAEKFPETFHGHLAAGLLAMQENRYEDARREFAQAVSMDPNDDSARYNLAVALLDLGRNREVVDLIGGNEMKEDLENSRKEVLAHAYANLGNFPQAQQLRATLPNQAPVDSLSISKGRRLLAERKWVEAKEEFGRTLAEHPGDPESLRGLGLASYNAGDFLGSMAALEQVAGTPIADLPVYQALGSDYQQFNRFEDAARVFTAGLARFPDDLMMLERLGYIEYAELKRYPEARQHLSRLLALQPGNPRADEYRRAIEWMERQAGMGQ
jgi:tetratricopeptide (TPR) repeat protein